MRPFERLGLSLPRRNLRGSPNSAYLLTEFGCMLLAQVFPDDQIVLGPDSQTRANRLNIRRAVQLSDGRSSDVGTKRKATIQRGSSL
jgi:hypothetical protein